MHLDLLVFKITDVLTEGALVYALLNLKQISFHFKISQRHEYMNWWSLKKNFVYFTYLQGAGGSGRNTIQWFTLNPSNNQEWEINPSLPLVAGTQVLSHLLLPSSVHLSRKVKSVLEPGWESCHSNMTS